MNDWYLELSMVGPHGERVRQCVALDHRTATDIQRVEPPHKFTFAGANISPFEATVQIMKRRVYRKELFIESARKLGGQLAERMEDAEGWHDESRIEPAKKALTQ